MGWDDDRFYYKRRNDFERRKRRNEFVTRATGRLSHDPEALAVLHGVDYESERNIGAISIKELKRVRRLKEKCAWKAAAGE